MVLEILKRDGSRQHFQAFKIKDAITKAFMSESTPLDSAIYDRVIQKISNKRSVAVEDIQDSIEHELYNARYFDVMKSFMLYRLIHKMQREQILGINEDTTYINTIQTVEE